MLFEKYYEYFESYLESFYVLYEKEDKEKHFYPIGLIFSNFMELWIKFCVLNYDGWAENYTINEMGIGKHDFYSILKDEQTRYEFLQLGIKESEYDSLLVIIAKIAKLLNCDEFSFAFRYPTDKKSNKLYLNDLSAIKKDEIIEKMKQCMELSLFVLLKHEEGVVENLKINTCVLEKFIKEHTS